MPEMISFQCPACQSLVTVERAAGSDDSLRCPQCGQALPTLAPLADQEVYAAEIDEPTAPCETAPPPANSHIPWWGYAVGTLVLIGMVGGLTYLYYQKAVPQRDVAATPDNNSTEPIFGPADDGSNPSNKSQDRSNAKRIGGIPPPPPMPPPPKLPPLPEEVAQAIIAEKRELLPGTWHTDLPYPITIVYKADGRVSLTTVFPMSQSPQRFEGRWRILGAINQRTLTIEWEAPDQRRQRMEVIFELDGDIQHPIWGQPCRIPKLSKNK